MRHGAILGALSRKWGFAGNEIPLPPRLPRLISPCDLLLLAPLHPPYSDLVSALTAALTWTFYLPVGDEMEQKEGVESQTAWMNEEMNCTLSSPCLFRGDNVDKQKGVAWAGGLQTTKWTRECALDKTCMRFQNCSSTWTCLLLWGY